MHRAAAPVHQFDGDDERQLLVGDGQVTGHPSAERRHPLAADEQRPEEKRRARKRRAGWPGQGRDGRPRVREPRDGRVRPRTEGNVTDPHLGRLAEDARRLVGAPDARAARGHDDVVVGRERGDPFARSVGVVRDAPRERGRSAPRPDEVRQRLGVPVRFAPLVYLRPGREERRRETRPDGDRVAAQVTQERGVARSEPPAGVEGRLARRDDAGALDDVRPGIDRYRPESVVPDACVLPGDHGVGAGRERPSGRDAAGDSGLVLGGVVAGRDPPFRERERRVVVGCHGEPVHRRVTQRGNVALGHDRRGEDAPGQPVERGFLGAAAEQGLPERQERRPGPLPCRCGCLHARSFGRLALVGSTPAAGHVVTEIL
jgi:hypothetical protein